MAAVMQKAALAGAGSSAFIKGQSVRSVATGRPCVCREGFTVRVDAEATDNQPRIRLNNLTPLPGSRTKKTRKGRGHAAGQGATCGFGNRGQNSRSGSGTRPGFEGGQNPLYRALPKQKGIAGGMGAGLPKFVTVNLSDISQYGFADDEPVSLESLKAKGKLNASGREAKLPLKVLGDGELTQPLTIHAAAFSASALTKIEASGGKAEKVALKPKWTRALHEERKAAAAASA